MAMSNRARVGRTMELLTEGLTPFVERELKSHLGGYWVEKLAERTRVKITKGSVSWDAQSLLKAMVDNWRAFRACIVARANAYVAVHLCRYATSDAYRSCSCRHVI